MNETLIEDLEKMVDAHGIHDVLLNLARVCMLKAGHIEENWQDIGLSRNWDEIGQHLETLSDRP
jgi:hypothetical protein